MSKPTVHHYESNYNWQDETNIRDLPEGDIVIALDPQERLGQSTYCVLELDEPSISARVVQRGLFWKVGEARRYAKALAASDNDE